jgi:hypothetical protein
VTKDGKVFIDWYGRQAMVLKEKAAQRFFQRVAGLDERGTQLGNLKRGHER